MASSAKTDARAADAHEVRERSAGFRKELGLGNLVLTQIMFVMGASWVGAAAKLGQAQVVFWLLAITLFYIPQAITVIYLNTRMPLEGGLYQWAKMGFNEFTGFLVGWNLWLFTITVMSALAIGAATTFAYAIAAHGTRTLVTPRYLAISSTVLILVMMLVAIVGLRLGKWVHAAGGIAQLLTFLALVAAPFLVLLHGGLKSYHPLAIVVPTISLFSLNVFGKMGMGALSGLEYVAILAGECRNPARSIGRSVIVAIPVVGLLFILGTASVLAFVPQGSIDLISPIPQALRIAFPGAGIAAVLVPMLILFLFARTVADMSYVFTGNTRLPMVAGWDGLLPSWFSRLDSRFRTPRNSILFVGAATLVFALLSLVGVGAQEAFQLIDNAAGIFYALAYLVMFALPLAGVAGIARRAPWWLKLAAGSGFATTLLYTVLSVFPIIDVPSWGSFAAKIIVVIVGANIVGALLFFVSGRRRADPAAPAAADASRV
ncbi:MAG TPA: APC family permease [Gemmatimonadaceae bacterium]|nr:APC family permease [Gemmatimonadaceae bacterium]